MTDGNQPPTSKSMRLIDNYIAEIKRKPLKHQALKHFGYVKLNGIRSVTH